MYVCSLGMQCPFKVVWGPDLLASSTRCGVENGPRCLFPGLEHWAGVHDVYQQGKHIAVYYCLWGGSEGETGRGRGAKEISYFRASNVLVREVSLFQGLKQHPTTVRCRLTWRGVCISGVKIASKNCSWGEKVSLLERCPYFGLHPRTALGEREGVLIREVSSFQGCH